MNICRYHIYVVPFRSPLLRSPQPSLLFPPSFPDLPLMLFVISELFTFQLGITLYHLVSIPWKNNPAIIFFHRFASDDIFVIVVFFSSINKITAYTQAFYDMKVIHEAVSPFKACFVYLGRKIPEY